jgi:hypothetical protein
MSKLDQSIEMQVKNIQTKTGKTLDEMVVIIQRSGLSQHDQIRNMLHREMGLAYADASVLVDVVFQFDGTPAEVKTLSEDRAFEEMYVR